jgi:RHS repeat-associated protein
VTENTGTARSLFYSKNWQVLEERVSGVVVARNVWSPVYVDAMVLRDRDTDANGTLDERLYAVQDANYNVTALLNISGSVVERFLYDPYGTVTVLASDFSARSGSQYAWVYGFQGGRQSVTLGLVHLRSRDLSVTLGRWTSNDHIRFEAGDINLYRALGNNSATYTDPSGAILPIVPILVVGLVVAGGVTLGGLWYTHERYRYEEQHYMSKPAREWTPEVQAEFQSYHETSRWINATANISAATVTAAGLTTIALLTGGYLWTWGPLVKAGVLLAGAGMLDYAILSTLLETARIGDEWGGMDAVERYEEVGSLVAPWAASLGIGWAAGPRLFKLGMSIRWPGRVGPVCPLGRIESQSCFPADTPVMTEDGFKPIQCVRSSDRVWGYHLDTGEWKLKRVIETYEHDYQGNLVAISVDGDLIEATSNHPFWVVEGERLDRRECPDHVPATPPDSQTPGRWVDAGNLRVGDVLLLRSERRASIRRLSVRHVQEKVYNFQVEEVHNYAVGVSQLLVHNKAKAYQRAYNGPKSRYINPGTHDPTSPNFVRGKSPLPTDADVVYRHAIPDPATTDPVKQTWYGRSPDGSYYRYQGTNGEVHFNGIVEWNNLPTYIQQRFRGLGFRP